MELNDHLRLTGGALKRWFIAQTWDALSVAALWLIGLTLIGVLWAPLWAVLAFFFQYIPPFGLVLALVGPAAAAAYTGGWMMLAWTLGLYAAIAVIDGFVLQPIFMKQHARSVSRISSSMTNAVAPSRQTPMRA